MSFKIKNILFIACMVGLFIVLWGTAGLFAKPKEGTTGFGERPDISPDEDELVFSYYHDGDAALYTASLAEGGATLLEKPNDGESYIHPVFSPDGKQVAFIKHWEEDKNPYGELMMMDRTDNGKAKELTKGDNLVTETAFSPDGKYLYFLLAGVYKNYSPIASEHPHDFDIYRMDVKSEQVKQVTYKEAYDMSDLEVGPDGDELMYQSNDTVLCYSLEDESEAVITPTGESSPEEPILSSPSLSPDGKQVVFSGVANKDERGTYVYEGFQMDAETGESEQVTSFHEHVANLEYFNDPYDLLVTIDNQFAQSNGPDYEYWLVDLDNDQRQRLSIEIPSDQES